MKSEKFKSQIEVFVCNKESCCEKGAKELTDKLRKWVKEEHKGDIKIFRSGCLGRCEEGISIACFPENKYLLEVKLEDCKEIKKGLIEALEKLKN
jgi:(2Fe-2S) ferredoxin